MARRNPHLTTELLYAGVWALQDVAKQHFQTWRKAGREFRPFWRERAQRAITEHRALYLAVLHTQGAALHFATWTERRKNVIRCRKARIARELQKAA